MVIVIVLSIWLKLYWLAALVAAVMGILFVSAIEVKRPSPVPAGGKGEEIITPVIVQDIGEPPYLYPPNFDLKFNPEESLMPRYYIASLGFAALARTIIRTARGDKHRPLKNSKVQWHSR
jgi:hypothetical protein